MIVIWGFRVRRRTLDTGTFWCPQEGGDRAYERVELRRWFTLFWIPLIPLKVLGEAIHCTSCDSDWDPQVLTRPTTERMSGELGELATLVATALLDDGSPTDDQVTAASAFVVAFGGDVERLAAVGAVGGDRVEAAAGPVGTRLSPAGLENVVAAAIGVADADGSIGDHDLAVLTNLARGLGMTRAHFEGVLAAHRQRGASDRRPGTGEHRA